MVKVSIIAIVMMIMVGFVGCGETTDNGTKETTTVATENKQETVKF